LVDTRAFDAAPVELGLGPDERFGIVIVDLGAGIDALAKRVDEGEGCCEGLSPEN
jgi:hypothetical protein